MEQLLGYLRDFIAAELGVAILFGVNMSDDQVAGILLVVTTGAAFGTYAYGAWKRRGAAQ